MIRSARDFRGCGLAGIYFSLGDDRNGFEQLTRAFDQRVGQVRWINVAPEFDRVRRQFQALVSRLHLPSPATR